MGTRLIAAVAKTPLSETPLNTGAIILGDLAKVAPESEKVIIHLSSARMGAYDLLWCEVDESVAIERSSEEAAKILSRNLGTSVSLFYSDSLGEAGYVIFEHGLEVSRNDSPIIGDAPMYPRFAEGLEKAFPAVGIQSPEDALDILGGPDSKAASFIVARLGQAVSPPETYVPPPTPPYKPSIFHKEFTWGKKPRSVVRGCAIVYGLITVALIVGIVAWFVVEWWRTH